MQIYRVSENIRNIQSYSGCSGKFGNLEKYIDIHNICIGKYQIISEKDRLIQTKKYAVVFK